MSTVFERDRPDDAVVDAALAGSRHRVFWLDDLGDRPRHPSLSGTVSGVDVAVVGGGYTGLWTAILAKQRDPSARVVVIEGGRIGWAASGRNGGFVDASLTHGRANGEQRWPEEVDRLDALGLANLDAIERQVGEFGIDAHFERVGSIDVAVEPHQIAWLKDDADAALARGEDVRFLDAAAMHGEVHSPTYLAGVEHRRTTALVHPGRLVTGLAAAATDLGVELFEGSLVTAMHADSGPDIVLATDEGTVRAARVVLATNVFRPLLGRYRFHTVPVYDYALMTEPLKPGQLDAIGWSGRQGLGDVGNRFHYYRRTADDRILFGGYDAVYHYGGRVRERYEDRTATYRDLAAHFFTTFPQLAGSVRFSHRWAGAIDTSSRFSMFFGRGAGGRVALAAGFTGLGVGASRFAAETLLDLVQGLDTERTRLRMVRETPLPFPPEPAASIGIAAMRTAMAAADRDGGRRNLFLRSMDRLGFGFDS